VGGDGRGDVVDPQGRGFADLPVEIAFLPRHGVAPAGLALAARRARRYGTDAVREVFALGLIDQESYYRALAAELGLPFHTDAFDLLSGGRHEAILRGGIAPLAGPVNPRLRFLLAPEGAALRHMISAGARHRDDVAVTTPRRFADRLREANGEGLARSAAGLDEPGLARDSARTGASRGQVAATGIGLATATLGGIFAPLESFFALALLLGPLFLGLILLRLAASIERTSPISGAPSAGASMTAVCRSTPSPCRCTGRRRCCGRCSGRCRSWTTHRPSWTFACWSKLKIPACGRRSRRCPCRRMSPSRSCRPASPGRSRGR
jgi:hypothetical protein